MVHIFTAKMQPATDFIDDCGAIPIHFSFKSDDLLYCQCCNKEHTAKDCVVQVYYDDTSTWCAPGKGCKDPHVIDAKKAKEFANRSAGQKKRYAKCNA